MEPMGFDRSDDLGVLLFCKFYDLSIVLIRILRYLPRYGGDTDICR